MAKEYIHNGTVYTLEDDKVAEFLEYNSSAQEYTGQEITGDLVGQEEENVVDKLNANYGGQGFSFTQSGMGDNITATNYDGTISETFSFDNTGLFGFSDNEAEDAKVAAEMNQWMKDNKQPEMNDDGFGEISGSELQRESVGSMGLRVEENAVKHLNELYKNKGVWFEDAVGGQDVVRAHKGGRTMDVALPNNWNNKTGDWTERGFFGGATSDKSLSRWDMAAQQINTFVQRVEGTSKFKEQRKTIQDGVTDLLNNKEWMADIGANENALYNVSPDKNPNVQSEDNKYNEIAKAIKAKFGTNHWYGGWDAKIDLSEISRVEMDHIIEDAVEAKATTKKNSDAVRKYQNGMFAIQNSRGTSDGYNKTTIKENTVDSVLDMRKELNFATLSVEERNLATLVDQWYQLQDKVKNGETVSDEVFQSLESQISTAREQADNFYTASSARVDRYGNALENVKDVKLQGGYTLSPEEYEAALAEMEGTIKTFGETTKDLYEDHQLNMYFSDVEGNEKVDIVVNDVTAQAILNRGGYKKTGETPLGITYNVDYGFLADNISIIDNDGTAFADRRENTQNLKYDSDEGYFGLLEFDDQQQIAGAKGNYGDIETYTQGVVRNEKGEIVEGRTIDYSKNFIQDLRTYRADRKRLIANNYAINRLYLMNEDPSSRVDSAIEEVMDFGHHMVQTVGQGAVNIFDSDYTIATPNQSRQRDLEDLGGITSYKVVKDKEGQDVVEYNGVELTDKEKEAKEKGVGYSITEGVASFIPAIAEFAAIEYATSGLGSAVAFSNFGMRMGMYAPKAIKAFEKLHGVSLAKNADKFWQTARAVGQGGKNSLQLATKGKVMLQTAKVLNEELKMGIVMGDDYHVGSGAAFYGVGQLLNKVLPKTIGQSSRAKTLMDTFKSGSSGMLGIKASEEVHALIEDLKGNESYMKHIDDNYSDYSAVGKQALVDFFVFSLVGYKGTIDNKGGKWLGMKGRKTLDTLRGESVKRYKDAMGQMNNMLNGREVKDLSPSEKKMYDKAEANANRHFEIYHGANNRLSIIKNEALAQDPKAMTKEYNKRGESILAAVDGMSGSSGKGKTKFKVVKDRKGMSKEGSAAEFVKGEDGSLSILIDNKKAKWGQISQEVGHMIMEMKFSEKGGRLAAEKMKLKLKEGLEGFTMRAVLKNSKGEFIGKDGKVITEKPGTLQFELSKVEKDFSMEDYITNEYGSSKNSEGKSDFAEISAEEFVMNTLEALADVNNRDKILGGRILDRFSRVMNNQLGKQGFKNGEFNKNMKGKELVEWLGNLSIAMSKGKVTSKQLERFETLMKDPILDQHVNSVGPSAERRQNEKTSSSRKSADNPNFIEAMSRPEVKITNEDRSAKNTELTKDWMAGKPKELAERLNVLEAQGKNLMQNQPEGFRESFNAIKGEILSLKKRNKVRQQLLENNMGTLMNFLYGKGGKGGAINPRLIEDVSQKQMIEASAVNEALKIIDRYDPAKDPEFGRYFKGSLTGPNPKGFQKQGDILRGANINLNKRFTHESIDDIAVKRELEDRGEGDAFERMVTRETIEADLVKELSVLRTLKLSVKEGGFGLKKEQVDRIQERLVNRDWYKEDLITIDNVAKDIISEVMGNTITEKVAWAIKGDNWEVIRDAVSEQSFEIAREDLGHRVGADGSQRMSTKLKGTVVRDMFEDKGETVSLKREGSTQNLPKQSKMEFTKETFLNDVLLTTVGPDGKPVSINADSALGKRRKKAYNNIQFEMGRGLSVQIAGDVIRAGHASGSIAIKTTLKDLLTKVQDGKSKSLSSPEQLNFIESMANALGDAKLHKLVNGLKDRDATDKEIGELVKRVEVLLGKGINLRDNYSEKEVRLIEEFASSAAGAKAINLENPNNGLVIINEITFGENGYAISSVDMKPIVQFLHKNMKGVRLEVQVYIMSRLLETGGYKLTVDSQSGLNTTALLKQFEGNWKRAMEFVADHYYDIKLDVKKPVDSRVKDATIIPTEIMKSSMRKIIKDNIGKSPEDVATLIEAQINEFYVSKGTTFKEAYEANKFLRQDIAGMLFDYVTIGPKETMNKRYNDVFKLIKQQSKIPGGFFRALNPLTAFTVSKGSLSNQHTVAVLNHNIDMMKSMSRNIIDVNTFSRSEFIKEFKQLDKMSDISFTTKTQQKHNDSKAQGGATRSKQGSVTGVNKNVEMVHEYKNLIENFILTPEGKAISVGDYIASKHTNGSAKVKASKELKSQIESIQAIVEKSGGKKVKRGISVWDFDDTLATTNSKINFTTPDGKKGKLNAEQYAKDYVELAARGYKFDFSEFSKVMMGEKGPLFEKALARNEKFGNDNVYVLTARPANANTAIHEFLKGIGLDVKIENITGLANSTAEAKAGWMVKKVGEGYNDFYFADDAIQNVRAVKNVLEQFDVKSKTQLAIKSMASKNSDTFAEMMERRGGVKAKVTISEDNASVMGRNKFEPFLPPSAEDFGGLMYKNYGKGKQGEKDMKFIEDKLGRPYEIGIQKLNQAKQKVAEDYAMLAKSQPEVVAILKDQIPGMKHYTYEQAIRSFLFEGAGHEIKSQSKEDRKKLNEIVTSNPNLVAFAHNLGKISLQKDGYTKPQKDWLGNGIQQDLLSSTARGNRALYLDKWIKNKEAIFTPENMTKLKALHGPKYVEALDNMLWRMENGVNRNKGEDRFVDFASEAMSNSVGAIMWMNVRSATLQMLSTSNFVNWGHNNILNVGKTLANPKQYWKDVSMIFNSSWAKQRRSGLKTDVNHVDLAEATTGAVNKPRAALNWLIQKGFMPTQMADSFAISLGGASYFRNTVKKYVKEGKTPRKAEELAWLDFQGIAEKTQQSSRPDLISQQQASGLGRFVLAFANTPMQYNRIIKKSFLDIKNGRGDIKSNISRIIYYGGMQNLIFSTLQAGLFGVLFGDNDEQAIDKKQVRVANSMLDTILRGSGYAGASVSALKNMLLEFKKQDAKGYKADHVRTVLSGLSISPPLSSRIRKTYSGLTNYKWQKKVIDEMPLTDLDNPIWAATGNVVEGMTNIPMSRLLNKTSNVKEALSGEHEAWKSIAMLMGWNSWDVGVENTKLSEIKARVKSRTQKEGVVKAKYTRKYNKIKKEIEETGGMPGTTAFIKPNGEVYFVLESDIKVFMEYNSSAEVIK
jgi:hypothetical protein